MLRFRPLNFSLFFICSVLTLWLGITSRATAQAMPVLTGQGPIANAAALHPNAGDFDTGPRAAGCADSFAEVEAGFTGVQYGSVAWGDFDKDGDLDLLVTGSTDDTRFGGITKIYRNDNGIFTDIAAGLKGVWRSSVAWGDYDNDSDLDILLTGEYDNGDSVAKIYRNDNSVFTDINAALTGVSYGSVAWGDYDNDSDLDILITGEAGSNGVRVAQVYRNNGGIFGDIGATLTGVAFSSVAWGDYDKDGDLDILLTGRNSNDEQIAKLYRNEAGNFVDANASLGGVAWGNVAWGDYDNDGDPDILLSGSAVGFILTTKVYRNDGNGAFVDIEAGLVGVADSSVAWGDYDKDGDLDILMAGLSNSSTNEKTTRLYRNDGNNTFTHSEVGLTGVQYSSVAWGDYDNDDDLDILLTGRDSTSSSVTKLYRNNHCKLLYLPAIVR